MVSKNVKEGIEYRLVTLDVMIAVPVGNTGISVERERGRRRRRERDGGREEWREGGRRKVGGGKE